MTRKSLFYSVPILLMAMSCQNNKHVDNATLFPDELVNFLPYQYNPIFSGTGVDTWDQKIRERGYILKEDGIYKMWYTGYNGNEDVVKKLGYATSDDGIHWTRYPGNPIFDKYWTEDVFVVHYKGTYYMTAEGKNDIAHMLSSDDGIHWTNIGNLDIRKTDRQPIDPGPYGTPTLWIENGNWYLFYERNDQGIWLAKSTGKNIWTNVQDEPVINKGPASYDAEAVALDQVIKYKGKYYAYYHGSPDKNWKVWNSDIAESEDLVHWTKYEKNPVVRPDSLDKDISSPILVRDGDNYRLYTMHDSVRVYFPAK